MSTEVVSQRIKKTCDGCDKVVEFELVNPTDDEVTDMTQWFTIVREVLDSESGRFVKLVVQACSISCVSLAAMKLQSVPSNAPDNIDLDSLRARNLAN